MRIVNPHIVEDSEDKDGLGYAVGCIQGQVRVGFAEAWFYGGRWNWQDTETFSLSPAIARNLAAALLAAADETEEVGRDG